MKISIITASLNRAETILECLSSIASQSFDRIEHIVIDGGSNDGTLECLRRGKYAIDLLMSGPDDGIYDALNKGIRNATGDIIGILHTDDVYAHKNVISDVNNFFELNPSIDIVIGNVTYFNQIKMGWPTRLYKSHFFKPWMFRFGFTPAHTATFIRKSVFDRFGLYRTDLKSAGDFEFFLRVILVHSVTYAFLGCSLVYMQNGGKSNSSLRGYFQSSKEIIFALKKNGVYSNWAFVFGRLPIKVIWICLCKLILIGMYLNSKINK